MRILWSLGRLFKKKKKNNENMKIHAILPPPGRDVVSRGQKRERKGKMEVFDSVEGRGKKARESEAWRKVK